MDDLIKDGEPIRKPNRPPIGKIINCEVCGETHYEGGYCRGAKKTRPE